MSPRASRLAAVALLLLLSSSAPVSAASTLYTLPSGLRVVLVPRPGAATVGVALGLPVGEGHEPEGRAGLAHLAEHLVAQLPEPLAALTEVGAIEVNAFTGVESTLYVAEVPRAAWRTAVWAEARRLAIAPLAASPEALAVEQRVLRRELEYRDAEDWLNVALLAALYPADHPYHRSPDTQADVEALTAPEVQGFLQRTYVPDHAVLVVVGDVDPAELVAEATRVLGPLPATGAPRPPLVGYQVPPECVAIQRPTLGSSTALSLVWRYPPRTPRVRLALMEALLERQVIAPLAAEGWLAGQGVGHRMAEEGALVWLQVMSPERGRQADLREAVRARLDALAPLDRGAFEEVRVMAAARLRARAEAPVPAAMAWAEAALVRAPDPDAVLAGVLAAGPELLVGDAVAVAGAAPTLWVSLLAEPPGRLAWWGDVDHVACPKF
ncbi:MAG: insulinase family protein [Deltaproteobacteria bacterium]|nr:insulinase family protein [Deltaproteobacteria bacterium]